MSRKIEICVIALIITLVLFLIIWNIIRKNDEEILLNTQENEVNIVEVDNSLEISDPNVSNSIIDENSEENMNNIDELIENANSELKDDMRFLVKSVNGYIYVFYLSDDNEEFLYKRTTISVDYLSQSDMDDLEVGIEVKGSEELNKLLEDFE